MLEDLNLRRQEILAIARSQGRVNVEELASRFEVTPQTIRKDLNELCEQRVLSRIHGGAVIASGVENVGYEARRFIAQEEKKAIGAAAAALIPNNSSLFVNIGTTTEEVARAFRKRGIESHLGAEVQEVSTRPRVSTRSPAHHSPRCSPVCAESPSRARTPRPPGSGPPNR